MPQRPLDQVQVACLPVQPGGEGVGDLRWRKDSRKFSLTDHSLTSISLIIREVRDAEEESRNTESSVCRQNGDREAVQTKCLRDVEILSIPSALIAVVRRICTDLERGVAMTVAPFVHSYRSHRRPF